MQEKFDEDQAVKEIIELYKRLNCKEQFMFYQYACNHCNRKIELGEALTMAFNCSDSDVKSCVLKLLEIDKRVI